MRGGPWFKAELASIKKSVQLGDIRILFFFSEFLGWCLICIGGSVGVVLGRVLVMYWRCGGLGS